MKRKNLIEREGTAATFATVARVSDSPIDLRQAPPRASYQVYLAGLGGWLRTTWQRERERRELAAMRSRDFGDLAVPPSLVIDELRRWPWQKSSPLWGQALRERCGDGEGASTRRLPTSRSEE